jgi:hypothetical protein
LRGLRKDENEIRAETVDLSGDVVPTAGSERVDGDDRGDGDEDAENGERRAKRVLHDGPKRQ